MILGPQEWLDQLLGPSAREQNGGAVDPRSAAVQRQMLLQGSRSNMPVDAPEAPPEGVPMPESGYSEDVLQPQPPLDRIMRESNAEVGSGYHHGEAQLQELIDAILGRQRGI